MSSYNWKEKLMDERRKIVEQGIAKHAIHAEGCHIHTIGVNNHDLHNYCIKNFNTEVMIDKKYCNKN